MQIRVILDNMAVANPCHKKEWEDWKREMEENRRRRWRQRLSRLTAVEVSDEEEEEEDEREEEEAQDSEEEEVRKDEEIQEEWGKMSEVTEMDGEGEDALGDEVRESKTGDEEETNESVDSEEEDEEINEEREVMEDEQVAAEEVMEAVEVEEEEREAENDVGRGVEENREVDRGEEEHEGENEFEIDVMVGEEEQVEEEEDEEEEHVGQNHLAEQIREQTSNENIRQNQESVADLGESSNEDSDLTGSEDEESAEAKQFKDPEEDSDEKLQGDATSDVGAWTSQERKEEEDESEKLTVEEEIVATQDFQDDHKNLQEEEPESTDDEEAERSADEDVDSDDEDVVKIYCKDDYLTDVFGTLAEFRDSSVLTDLTLSTDDGHSFHVHSPVLAAVSSLILESLGRSVAGREEDEVHSWSVDLGPEVDRVGLEAVVEFAYTGLAPCLNRDNVHQVRAAAQTLGAPRLLDLCTEEEAKSTKTGGQKEEESISAAEQMSTSLQSIKQLWMDKVGCDVILDALRGPIHVHRVILAVCSDYFRSMFTLGMRESRQTSVTLPCLLASELEVLIDCSYSGVLPLSWSCVFELTTIALQLQYQPALSLCLRFLHQEINPYSCLDVASFAEAYEMVQLLEAADDFVLRQFQKVSCTSKFKDLPAKQLLKYLNSQSLCVPSELVVFKAVVAWIQAKPKRRLRLAKELMKTIHFPLMTFKEFKEVQSLDIWSDHRLAELFESIFEEFCTSEAAAQSKCRVYLPKESLILIGGDHTSEDLSRRSVSRELWFGNSLRNHLGIKKAMEWRRLGEMPDGSRYRHEVAVIEGQLYLFGGKRYYGTNDTLNSVYRYDPCQNSWEALADMQEKRNSFSVVMLDGKIYAIGGHCDPDYIESVEQYCPIANSWSFTCPLDLPLSAHVAKVLHRQIFVCGGLSSNYQCLASMFRYHPETGSTYLANMAKPRAHHCMESLGDYLYVAGGITTDDNLGFFDQLACEVYNPAADYWTAFTPLQVPHVGAGSALLEGKFYVLGGYSQEDDSDTKMVHRYDPATLRWENMGKMPGPNNDIRACVLSLPPHFRM